MIAPKQLMTSRRLTATDIAAGQALAWDVVDSGGALVRSKGQVIEDDATLAVLLGAGLFAASHAAVPAKKMPQVSVLRALNTAQKRLNTLLRNLADTPDLPGKVMEIAALVHTATTVSANIAHACILLNQRSGEYSTRHAVDTAVVALLVARRLKKTSDEMKALVAAALTMNLGMLQQQDALQDRTDALAPKEIEHLRLHPERSVALLREAGVDNVLWLENVAMHHENGSDSGYPQGHAVGDIPQNAYLLSVADQYCAAIVQRKYRRTLLPHVALREILINDGKPRDPLVAAGFIKEIGNFPAGTFVRLHTDEIGVVIKRGAHAAMPLVQSLLNPRGVALDAPILRDTSKPLFGIREAIPNDGKLLRFSMQQLWGNAASL